jgi:hypothetical protein
LIVVTLARVFFARLAYVRQIAAFHRQDVVTLVHRFSRVVNQTPDWVIADVNRYAKYDFEFDVNPWNNPWDLDLEAISEPLTPALSQRERESF